jgi:glycosyltransferase involved in cell wall biosynthesis
MNMTEFFITVIFWANIGLIAYVYFVYPILVAILARLFGKVPKLAGPDVAKPSVAVVIAAFNEAGTIGRRIAEFTQRFIADGLDGEVIVVSDGSTDATVAIAREYESKGPVRVIDLGTNRGKAVALTEGVAAAKGEIIVFADARQIWADDALVTLLSTFADPSIGAVSGDLVVESAPGVMAGVGLYWRYEKWIRTNEGRFHSTVGATGAISSVRRALFHDIPAGTILDDVYWPLCVALQGKRVVHQPLAKSFDRLPDHAKDEFRRKVRTLAGNFQLVVRLPKIIWPVANPIFVQFASHKLGRLIVPWAAIKALVANVLLLIQTGSVFYGVCLLAQVACYGLGLMGLMGSKNKLASAAGSFLLLNAAAWMSFWVWITGNAGRSWSKVKYAKDVETPIEAGGLS